MERRAFLGGLSVATGSLLAGCNALGGSVGGGGGDGSGSGDRDGDEGGAYPYYVSLLNYADAPQTIDVLVEDADGAVLLDETYQVDAESAREDQTFDGDPARASVTVGDRRTQEFTWPRVEDCREDGHGGKPGLEVRVMYDDPAKRDDVHYQWRCQSLQAESGDNR